MNIKNLFTLIEKGKSGKNIGISTGMKKLDTVLYGIQKGYLYTIGASSGVGKTSFVLDTFIYNLIKNANNTPISLLIYSFEMSKEVLLAKILSRYIYDTFDEVVTFEDILSLSKPLSLEHEELIYKSKNWLISVGEKLIIYDKPLKPDGIYGTCKDWLRTSGEFVDISEHKEDYIANNSEEYKVIIIDHVSLISGTNTKENIDTVAKYLIYFRNKCNITGIFVQQLNRGVSSIDRKTNGYELVGLQDFKDSSGTTDASEVVIALYSPYREKIARCEGYNIVNVLKSRFILIEIIKNRYGQSNVNIGSIFHGEINRFIELPKPDQISDYNNYLDLKHKDNEIINNNDIFKL